MQKPGLEPLWDNRTYNIQNEALARRVRIVGLCVLILLALIDTVYSRHAMQSDGISYLDMGDAIVRGDWSLGVSAHWSPFYPLLLGIALTVVKPSAYSQFTVVHVVNFLVYLFALGAFEFLLSTSANLNTRKAGSNYAPLPSWSLYSLGYAIFGWAFLKQISIERVSPDMLMSGFLFLATALLLKIAAKPKRFALYVAMGAVLGLGYLAKAPMFPLALLFLGLAGVVSGSPLRTAPRVVVAALVFLMIAAAWVLAVSERLGRFSFGDSARLNYVTIVDGASPAWYYQNLGSAGGRFQHNPRKLFDDPPVYEFATPIHGTIPIWNDPSYWSAGAIPRFAWRRQATIIDKHVSQYVESILTEQSVLLMATLILIGLGGRTMWANQLAAKWPIVVIALAGLGMYALVLAEPRYVAPFFLLFWVGLIAGVQIPDGRQFERFVLLVTASAIAVMAIPLAISAFDHLAQIAKGQPHTQWKAAMDLQRDGVRPADHVGRIGGRYSVAWARLLGVSVVAEVPRADARTFWEGTPELQSQVIDAFRRLGVTAIVTEQIPPGEVYRPGKGWEPLADGSFYLFKMQPQATP